MTSSGSFLEQYKQWYSSLPRIFRVIALPLTIAVLGAVLQVLPGLSDSFKLWGLILLCFLLLIGAYNQFIEMGTQDELELEIENLNSIIESKDGTIDELEALQDFWDRRIEDFAQLDRIFSELVLFKSEMWMEAITIANNESLEAGKKFIRTQNSIKKNLNRITASMYRFFDRYSIASINRHFRVSYFTPSQDGERLELTSWSSFQQVAPRSSSICSSAFSKGGASLAAFVWTRSDSPFAFIHNTEEYLNKHTYSSVFNPLNGTGASHIGSIACYRVEDNLTSACLGVLCVDCTAPDVFEEEIGEDVCKQIISSFATRIVFENRFSAMKTSLGPYPKEASQ